MSARSLAERKRREAKAAGTKAPPKPKDPEGAPALETWVDRARQAFDAGDVKEAVRICSRHVRAPKEDAVAISRAWEAFARPDFCKSLGRDPEAVIAAGVAATRRRIGR
jgi:hypothetical protein